MGSHEVVVADIGGSNARFAVADQDTLQLANFASYRCAEFPSITEVAQKYLSGLPTPPKVAAVAVAGPTGGEVVQLTNSTWTFRVSELRAALELQELLVLNDFEALAYALPCLEASDLHQLGGTEPVEHATKAVLGPGTGLGVAGLAWSPSGWLAVPSEGGHSTFAAKDAHELALVERLIAGRGHLSVERVVSGPGIVDVYRALAEMHGHTAPQLRPAEVVTRARSGADPLAREAIELFVTWLGRFAGDVALFFGARGGVYLGGGIAPKLIDFLSAGEFRRSFEAKGRMASYLTAIPVYVILSDDAALKGAAAALATLIQEP